VQRIVRAYERYQESVDNERQLALRLAEPAPERPAAATESLAGAPDETSRIPLA
jgi:hypothetical protein